MTGRKGPGTHVTLHLERACPRSRRKCVGRKWPPEVFNSVRVPSGQLTFQGMFWAPHRHGFCASHATAGHSPWRSSCYSPSAARGLGGRCIPPTSHSPVGATDKLNVRDAGAWGPACKQVGTEGGFCPEVRTQLEATPHRFPHRGTTFSTLSV